MTTAAAAATRRGRWVVGNPSCWRPAWCLACTVMVLLNVVAQQASAQTLCESLLTGGSWQPGFINVLLGDQTAVNSVDVVVRAAGFCGSIGLSNAPGILTESFANSSAIILSTGNIINALSNSSDQVASATTQSQVTSSELSSSYSDGAPLSDVVVLDLDIKLAASVTNHQNMTLQYLWATAEESIAYEDLTVLYIRECLDTACFAFGPSQLLSTLDGLPGVMVSLSSLRHQHASLLQENLYGSQPTPFKFFTRMLMTIPTKLQPGVTYRVTGAVADRRDSTVDTALLLGSMKLVALSEQSSPETGDSQSLLAMPPPTQVPPGGSQPANSVSRPGTNDRGRTIGGLIGGLVGGGAAAVLFAAVVLLLRRSSASQIAHNSRSSSCLGAIPGQLRSLSRTTWNSISQMQVRPRQPAPAIDAQWQI